MTGWIGVDFDGTLAHTNTGEPIWPMIEKVRAKMRRGFEFKILTARTLHQENLDYIWGWCITHIGRGLEITNSKDLRLIEIWDDRARQVVENTGEFA